MTDLATLSPSDLRAHARTVAAPRAHWTALAAILGRAEDEGLAVGYGYWSVRAWAVAELYVTPSGYVELARLSAAMRPYGNEPLWAAAPKARALTLRPILALGGDPTRWLTHAANLTPADWIYELGKAPTPGKWDRWVIAWPRDCVATREAALARIAEGMGIPAERIHDREVEHRLLLPLLDAVLGVTEPIEAAP